MKRVVIVGGGFAGVKAAMELAKRRDIEICLISDKLNFEYYSALYRSATGRSPLEVVIPLDNIFPKHGDIRLIQEKVVDIDSRKHTVLTDTGDKIKYDYLVMAVGQTPSYYGIKGVSEYAFNMDNIKNTIILRNHINQLIADREINKLTVVVIGAGASGVELAAELKLYTDILCPKHREGMTIDVIIVEGGDRVLPLLDEKLSAAALDRLEEVGVKVILGRRVNKVEDGTVYTDDITIKSDTIVWTAGFTNNPVFTEAKHAQFTAGRAGRIKVDEYLRSHSNIYVVGDSADTKFAGMAQTALYDGKYVADDIKRRLNKHDSVAYYAKKPIYVVPVGGQYAVMQWGFLKLAGRLAWTLRRLADLRFFIDFTVMRQAIRTWRKNQKLSKNHCYVCEAGL